MHNLISPKYQMRLVNSIQAKLHEEFVSYKSILIYIRKWHYSLDGLNYTLEGEKFSIYLNDNGAIDLYSTLHSMQCEDLLKIATDLGIETTDFIPATSFFKFDIKYLYQNVYETFMKGIRYIHSDPSLAIGLTNSAFESLIKEILKDDRIKSKLKGTETLYKLVQTIINEFRLDNKDFPQEVKTICSSLISISQSIEKLRSEKTILHGKTDNDLLIDDPIFVYLIINSFTTVGLFLNSYYRNRYPIPKMKFTDETLESPF